MNAELHYRADIDGLRAIAVLAVVFYHAGVPAFDGGFVGVDIFFVISGYLITSIIADPIRRGEFSFTAFYDRRIRRILPAFFVMLALCCIVAPLIMLPDDYAAFADSILASVLFASNMLFAREIGYFGETPIHNPLLHTWSLAVEEQFYIGLPIFLFLARRYYRRPITEPIALIGLVSFALSVWMVELRPQAAFFLAPTRAWELLLGSLLALRAFPAVRSGHARELLAWLGLVLIAGSICLLSPEAAFPGINALYPCLGTALVIHAGIAGVSVAGRLLRLRGLVFIGLISYSLYLWHWPLIVFAQYYAIRELTPLEMGAVVAASFLAAVACWLLVEQPIRQRRGLRQRTGLFTAAGSVTAAFLLFGLIARYGGLPTSSVAYAQSVAPDVAELRNADFLDCIGGANKRRSPTADDVLARKLCPLGDSATVPPSFVFWGDSHAEALRAGVDAAAKRHGVSGYFAGYISCPPALSIRVYRMRAGGDCIGFNAAVMELLADPRLTTVILHARWPLLFHGTRHERELGAKLIISPNGVADNGRVLLEGMLTTVARLAAMGKKIFIVAGVPEVGDHVPSFISRQHYLKRNVTIDLSYDDYMKRNRSSLQMFAHIADKFPVDILHPDALLCDGVSCRVEYDGELLYADDDHLSANGAMFLEPMFDTVFGTQRVPQQIRLFLGE